MSSLPTLRRYAALLAVGPALAACSGYPYSAGNQQDLATYQPPLDGVTAIATDYDPPMRGNYIVEPWNLGSEVKSAQADQPAVAALPGSHLGASFLQSLDGDYASFATSLATGQYQWADADYFSRKGLDVAAGNDVAPEDNRDWLIPNKFRPMLASARVRLVADLNDGARDDVPALAARAQVSYDCWVEKMETSWQVAENGPCRKQLEDALDRMEHRTGQAAALVAPAPSDYRYQVYFDFDKSALTPEASKVVGDIADRMRKDRGLRIALVGKADLVGTDAYNMRLSERRADRVSDTLVKDGIASDRMAVRWVGKREPPVPTPQGVREPRNRVVEVTAEGASEKVSQR